MRASAAMLTRPPSPRALGVARGAREIAVPGLDRDRPAALEVPNAHRPALHRGQRPIAAILGQPDGAAHGGRAVLAVRAELALAVAPQAAEDRLGAALLLLRDRGRGGALDRPALRARRLTLEHQVGDQHLRLRGLRLGRRLPDGEDPVVEVRCLRHAPARVVSRRHGHAAPARVELRAHRDVGRALQRHEALRPGHRRPRAGARGYLMKTWPETTRASKVLPGTGGSEPSEVSWSSGMPSLSRSPWPCWLLEPPVTGGAARGAATVKVAAG